MSAPVPAWRRLPLDQAVLLLCAVGLLGATLLPGFPIEFALGFALLATLRLTLGRDGRPLLPARAYRPLVLITTAYSLARLFYAIVAQGPDDALISLMGVMCVFQGLVLIGRQSVFGAFLLILFSSVHAAGTAFSFPGTTGLALTLSYVTVLLWTLILFERRAAYDREEGSTGAVLFVRPRGSTPLPTRSILVTLGALVLIGFPIGALLYLIVPPREFFEPDPVESDPGNEIEYAGEDVPAKTTLPGGSFESGTSAFTGPGSKGVPLGSIAEIKKDITPWFQVEMRDTVTYPPTVILRDNVQDHCRADGLWTDTLSAHTRPRKHRDQHDGKRDGWVPMGTADRGDGYTLRIINLRGGHQRLYLQPDAVRVRYTRSGRSRTNYDITESANETLSVDFVIEAGDEIAQRVVPQVPPGTKLEGRRSDSTVTLFDSHLQIPPGIAPQLQSIAKNVVGAERDPWRRARKLESWLNGPDFEYTLRAPPLDRTSPILDFLTRTRSGSCSYYATALTLLLRSLGHPTRYVRGFWGGDRLEEMRAIVLRGLHYHAWTEMYLDGVGWVPLNPTPPDRNPADGGTTTAAEEGPTEKEPEFSFLFYDHEQWSHLWSKTGSWISTTILQPIGTLFRGEGGYAGYPFLVALLLLILRGRSARQLRRFAAGEGRSLPAGLYGQALLLLAKRGMRRRPTWTAREFRRFVVKRHPATSRSLAALTKLHEQERFGGGATAREQARAKEALEELRSVLARKEAAQPA